MRTQNVYDRPPEVDLAPRWLAAFLLAAGLMTGAYALIHEAAELDEANGGHSAIRMVQRP